MINKKWIGLTSGLAACALIAVFVTRETRQVDARLGQPVLATAAGSAPDRIEISGSGPSLTLLKVTDGTWRIGTDQGFPADVNHIIRLIDQLERNRFQTVVAERKEDFAELGLDAPTKLILKDKDKELLALDLGNNRPRGGQYATIPGEAKAYLLSDPVQIYADAATWETKTLLNVARDQVQSASFSPAAGLDRKQALLARTKKEDPLVLDGLTATETASPSAKDVESLLERLTYSNRLDASNDSAKTALASASRVEVKTFDGRTYTVEVGSVGEKERKKHFIKVAAADANDPVNFLMQGNAFEVPEHLAKKYERGREDFVEAAKDGGKG